MKRVFHQSSCLLDQRYRMQRITLNYLLQYILRKGVDWAASQFLFVIRCPISDGPRVLRKNTKKHTDSCSFPSSIRTNKRNRFSFFDLKADVINDRSFPIIFVKWQALISFSPFASYSTLYTQLWIYVHF